MRGRVSQLRSTWIPQAFSCTFHGLASNVVSLCMLWFSKLSQTRKNEKNSSGLFWKQKKQQYCCVPTGYSSKTTVLRSCNLVRALPVKYNFSVEKVHKHDNTKRRGWQIHINSMQQKEWMSRYQVDLFYCQITLTEDVSKLPFPQVISIVNSSSTAQNKFSIGKALRTEIYVQQCFFWVREAYNWGQ